MTPPTRFAAAMLLLCLLTGSAEAQTVRKTADDFDHGGWVEADYNTAAGVVASSDEAAPQVPGKRSLLIAPSFNASFGAYFVTPAKPLVIPGHLKTVTLRTRGSDARLGLKVLFRDGWGRENVDGKELAWDVKSNATGDWDHATFKVPPDWVPPISVAKIGVHNWNTRNEASKVSFWVDQLEVETDLTDVDPATGALRNWKPEPNPKDVAKALKEAPRIPLVSVAVATAVEANVFIHENAVAAVRIQNWKPEALTGTIRYRLLDWRGRELKHGESPVDVESIAGLELPLEAAALGHYTLETNVSLSDGTQQTRSLYYARLPEPRPLSEAQKDASPYGVNYHGGGRLILKPFRKAGIVWFRDYAFAYDWLLRAKGDDGRYGGWPFYPRIMQAYHDADARVLPILTKSITPPKLDGQGKPTAPLGPDAQWTRNVAHILLSFPQMRYWEMANEYDLDKEHATAERAVGWRNYHLYHAKLGELCALLGGGELTAVENGRAGIWPDLVGDAVASGHFDRVGVVNSHHYTGVEPPETNHGNFNTGFEGLESKPPALFYDDLRAARRAGRSDGKPRQHWLTEFGWDDKAGKVVSPYEQAVYLQRGFMLAMAAGCEKAFWFFHFDAEHPRQFFDGCGLFTHDVQPKLALSAMAGLAQVLPGPRYVGMIDAGPNTAGYVFEQEGKLVAALFTITGDDGPTVSFRAEALYDFLGNRIDGSSAKLSMAPTYAVGLDRADPLFAQTAYSLDTPYMVLVAAGDPISATLLLDNNRPSAVDAQVQVDLPQGWQSPQTQQAISAPAGQKQTLPVAFTVGSRETLGMKRVPIRISEGGRLVKEIELKVLVQDPVVMKVSPLVGRPGETELTVQLGNKSRRPTSGTLRFTLPASWSTPGGAMAIDTLQPGEMREIKTTLTWSARLGSGETASVAFDRGNGDVTARPIIPNQLTLPRAGRITLDGSLDDWPAASRLPDWLLGSTLGDPRTRAHLAWADEGLYLGVDVADSRLRVSDPRSFWAGDVLELFLDTADDKRHRTFEPGDHQFWFVPRPQDNRVYVGRWKSKDEIAATLYDLPGIRSAARKTDTGYVMEVLLPREHLQNYAPRPGGRLGINLNLTVHGERFTREVFWPRAKEWIVNNLPKTWGTMELVE